MSSKEPGKWGKYLKATVDRFGIFCYPADYGNGARPTFIMAEEGVVWSKDTRVRPPKRFPLDPRRKGWKRPE